MIKFPRKDLEVFDFKEEDEIASENYLTNKNPILDHQSLSCHDAQVDKVGVKNVASIPCVDVDIVGGNFNLEKGGSDPSLDTGGDIFESKEKNSELEAANQLNSISQEYLCHFKTDIHNYNEPEKRDTSDGVSSPETSQNESVDVNSDADDCMNESAPTSPGSDIADNVSLNGCGFDGIDNSNMDGSNTDVILHPDYVIYQDNYCMEPKLTFSRCCIKLNFSTACKKQGAIDLEWEVDDVIDIKCQQFQNSATVIIKLRVISSNASQSKHVSDTSGIEELEIAVVDSNWSLRHKQITSLNMKYLAIWNVVLHTDLEGNGNDSHGSRCYFPNFEEPFDEVIYPKGDPDAVSLGKRDVDLLQPDTFINDTIIDFYIQYLKNQIQEEEKPRFHFFNSFFFRKLADMDKNPSSASDGKAAFLRVRKWTRKVNLFEKDYIFIPVNFNLHWSLIVICHPGEVVNFNDKQLDKSLKVPCILHMDSIKGSHSGLKNLVQSYLCEEWKERHKDALEEDLSSEFLNMRFLPLALPQQENSYDCGLFLLHYLELFLAEAPFSFNPCKITKSSNFLNVNWFLPAEAYLKRTLIQRLIFELVENHGSHENSSDECSDDQTYLENNENRTGIECAEINMESTTSNAEQGIEITLLSGSSSLNPQSYNNSGLVPKELLEPGATTTRTLLGQCQSFDQRSSDFRFNGSTIFSMEEDTDFMYLATVPNLQQVAGITPQTCSLPYLPRDCGDETCLGPEISLQVEHEMPEISLQMEHDMADASLVASSDASDDSEDIGIIENCPIGNNEPRSSNEAERDEKISSPTENPEHLVYVSGSDDSNLPNTCVMGISRESITKCDGNKNGDLHSSCHETRTVPLLQISDAVDENATCNDGQMLDDVAPDICEEQVAKRRRLMPLQCRSEGIVTESNL